MGCDRVKRGAGAKPFAISIHASRMGCDDTRCKTITLSSDFNPRIPYGMRLVCWSQARPVEFISIHASRMGCDLATSAHRTRAGISIHASRMGCDGSWWFRAFHPSNFNPRIPYGMRHVRILFGAYHAHFNPRIPYGMRPRSGKRSRKAVRFQSTHPVWDATRNQQTHSPKPHISIHASRMGCDLPGSAALRRPSDFNPRIPYGMRLEDVDDCGAESGISIHASRMGCDFR